MSYDIGDQTRLTASFVDDLGLPKDPDGVTLEIRDSSGAQATYVYGTDPGIVQDSIGSYHFDLSLTLAGTWVYRWQGTANPQTAAEGQLIVQPSQIAGPAPPVLPDPCAALAAAQLQLAQAMTGRQVKSIETPQLGRVEFSDYNTADLQRQIYLLQQQCAAATGQPFYGRRRPISVEGMP
jgi:hypothetical protein